MKKATAFTVDPAGGVAYMIVGAGGIEELYQFDLAVQTKPLVTALGVRRQQVPAGIRGAVSAQDFSPAYIRKAVEAAPAVWRNRSRWERSF